MALIGTIRKNSWLLIVAIGLALAAFVIMDMTSGGPSGGNSQFTLGEVNGQQIPWKDFQEHQQILYSGAQSDVFERRKYVWNYFVEKALVEQEAEALGLGVSSEEVRELEFGTNISPIVRQRFMNPQTGQVDRQQLSQIQQQIESGQIRQDIARFWSHQRKEVKKQRLQEKLQSLVAKGIYTPNWMVEQNQANRSDKVDFLYARVPYDLVEEQVSIEDSDIKKYMREHETEYRNDEETRNISYVSMQVEPTKEDSIALNQNIKDLIPRFAKAENDSLFVSQHYGSYNRAYIPEEELNEAIRDTLTMLDKDKIYGPYIADNAYKAVKMLDRKIIPDSVKASHIVRQVQNQQQSAQTRQLLDSLKNVIESGKASFDSVAMQYGQDRTAANGGDLGWIGPGNMVKNFNDFIFYYAEPGEIKVIQTQFGMHLVKVTDRKYLDNTVGFKLAYLEEPIIPSETTQNRMYDEALNFVGEHRTLESLEKAVEEDPNLALQKSGAVKKNDYKLGGLPPGSTSRDIIRWAFQSGTQIGDVSPDVYIFQNQDLYYNSQYVFAALNNIMPAGLPPVADVRSKIEPILINRKKADIVSEKISGKSLDAIASTFDVSIDTARNVTFALDYIGGIGNEPKVQASAFALEQGEISEPIQGQAGVYVIQVIGRTKEPPTSTLASMRQGLTSPKKNGVQAGLIKAMKDNAQIDDNRFTYY